MSKRTRTQKTTADASATTTEATVQKATVQEAPKTQTSRKPRRAKSADGKMNLTEAWYKVLSDNYKARLSDEELEKQFLKLMGGSRKKAQPAARIRGFFNSPKFPYFIQLAHLAPPEVKLPKFENGKPVGGKSLVAAYVKMYGTTDEKKTLTESKSK